MNSKTFKCYAPEHNFVVHNGTMAPWILSLFSTIPLVRSFRNGCHATLQKYFHNYRSFVPRKTVRWWQLF